MTPIFYGDNSDGARYGFSEFMSGPDTKLTEILDSLGKAATILASEDTASSADLSKALDLSHKAVDAVEAKTLTLTVEDGQSLYWAQVLSAAWSALGRAALDLKDMATAEDYLRAAWKLSEDRMTGYQLGRLLAIKGEKEAAARVWELANITSGGESLGGQLYSDTTVRDQIGEAYEKLIGKPMSAKALNNGQYNGSLRAELDRQTEFRGWVHSSKLNGQGLFILANEPGKPAKAHLLSGDKVMEKMIGTLETQKLPVAFPRQSKARMVREVRLICTPYAGCDAYIFLPNSVQLSVPSAMKWETPVIQHLELKQLPPSN
jgi:tetratricopeptide (TPR) repeat protein